MICHPKNKRDMYPTENPYHWLRLTISGANIIEWHSQTLQHGTEDSFADVEDQDDEAEGDGSQLGWKGNGIF